MIKIEKNDILLPNMQIIYTGGSQIGKFNGKIFIPKIDDEVLTQRYSISKPIVQRNGSTYSLLDEPLESLRDSSYIWNLDKLILDKMNKEELLELKSFLCLHSYGYYGCFKPSIAEILSQMPEELQENSNYFEITDSPSTTSDFNQFQEAFNEGYHVSKITTYKHR